MWNRDNKMDLFTSLERWMFVFSMHFLLPFDPFETEPSILKVYFFFGLRRLNLQNCWRDLLVGIIDGLGQIKERNKKDLSNLKDENGF